MRKCGFITEEVTSELMTIARDRWQLEGNKSW